MLLILCLKKMLPKLSDFFTKQSCLTKYVFFIISK